jgi:SAM-dependent methyltransferase
VDEIGEHNREQLRRPDAVRAYRRWRSSPLRGRPLRSATCPAGARVLDLGVGTGRTTPWLHERASTYLGIDVAPAMVEAARDAPPRRRPPVGDAADLADFDDGHLRRRVFSYNGIDYLVRRRPGPPLDEVRRVLAPGGTFLFSDPQRPGVLGRLPRTSSPLATHGSPRRHSTARRIGAWSPAPPSAPATGWVLDPAKGASSDHHATPERVEASSTAHGFALVERSRRPAATGPRPGGPRGGTTPPRLSDRPPLAAYHPELVLVGAGAAALGALAGRFRRGIQLEAAAVAAAAWLTYAEHLEPIAALAIAMIAIVSSVRSDAAASGRACRAVSFDTAVAVVAIALARTDASPAATVLVAGATAASVATLRAGAAHLRWAPAVLLLGACAATFGGAPDTEAAVVVGSTLAIVSAGAAVATRSGRFGVHLPILVGWATPCLVAFIATDSYRGRTGGLPAAVVASATVVLAAGLAARPTAISLRRTVPAVAVGLVAAIGAARTIGLDAEATPGTWGAATIAAVAVLASGWWAGAWRPVPPVSASGGDPTAHGRTPPG